MVSEHHNPLGLSKQKLNVPICLKHLKVSVHFWEEKINLKMSQNSAN